MFDLTGRVALVTGAGRGVGAAIAGVLALAGATVAVNDLHPGRAEAVADDLLERGCTALAVAADVREQDQVESMVGAVADAVGPVDVLVNNAGVPEAGLRPTPFVSTSREDWVAPFTVSVLGTMYCCRAVLPAMLERGRGRIVSVVSDAGRCGEPGLAAYSGAKAAVAGFGRALAKEVGTAGITCNCVSLGRIDGTGVSDDAPLGPGALRRYPAGRIGRVEDIGPAVLWLASEEGAWVTGQTIGVDGGYLTT